MGFIRRATLSLEQRIAKHKEEFAEINRDLERAVQSVRQQQSALLEKESSLLVLHREHVDA